MRTIQTLPRRRLQARAKMLPEPMAAPDSKNTVGGWEVEITGVKGRLSAFEEELRNQGRRQEEGFERVDRNFAQLFTRVDAATTKPPPWGLIVSALVGICTILIGIGGLGLTMAGGLALWANAYFGRNIAIAEQRADGAHERLERGFERVDIRLEKLQEFEWQTRAALQSSSPSPSLVPAAKASIE
jgi:hypothetical protein